jgi:hypothetical protein
VPSTCGSYRLKGLRTKMPIQLMPSDTTSEEPTQRKSRRGALGNTILNL